MGAVYTTSGPLLAAARSSQVKDSREVTVADSDVPPPPSPGDLVPARAVPVPRALELDPGPPYLLVQFGVRHSIGCQGSKKAGPGFVVVRISRLDTTKILERFPLTEDGWARTWHALVSLDAQGASRSDQARGPRRERPGSSPNWPGQRL